MKLTDDTTIIREAASSGSVWKDLYDGPGMRLVRVDYGAGFRHPRNDHSYGEMTLIINGSLRERVGTREVERGTLALTARRAGVEHACHWGDRGARVLSLEIDADFLPESEWKRVTRVPWTWVEGEDAARCLLRMCASAVQGRLHLEADDLVLEALATVDDEPVVSRGSLPPWLARAREARLECGPKPSTRDLAESAGMHPVHFARVFRRHLGCSPTELARRSRIRTATDALALAGHRDIGRVPYRCGYYDHSHMCRELRTSLGVTPSLLRMLSRPVRAASGPRR